MYFSLCLFFRYSHDSNANEEGEEEEEGNEEEEEEEDCPYRQWRLNRERRENIYVISI